MKKIYNQPTLTIVLLSQERPVATSNLVNGNSVEINANTMRTGDGSDASKSSGNWSGIWDE